MRCDHIQGQTGKTICNFPGASCIARIGVKGETRKAAPGIKRRPLIFGLKICWCWCSLILAAAKTPLNVPNVFVLKRSTNCPRLSGRAVAIVSFFRHISLRLLAVSCLRLWRTRKCFVRASNTAHASAFNTLVRAIAAEFEITRIGAPAPA